MMNRGGSSSEPAVDLGNEFDVDLDSWINELRADNFGESVMNFGVDAMTINPNYPSQPLMSTSNPGTNLGGGSANDSQCEITQEMMTMSSLTPSSNTTTLHSSGQILSSAPKFVSDPVTQNSQSHRTTDFPQYHPIQPTQTPQNQPLLHQVFKNKAVQQPLTHSITNQSNITFGDQKNQLHYQMPSKHLVPCTGPMVNTQTENLQNNQGLRVQMQQNSNQNQLHLQQVIGSSGNLISVGAREHGNNIKIDLTASVGFATPSEFPSSAAYRNYVLRQIRKMKEIYFNELQIMHHNAMQFRTQATNIDDSNRYGNVKNYLEKMMRFLNITAVDSIPKNDPRVYDYMNMIVNYMKYHMRDKPGGSSQHREPAHQPSKGPQVQPVGSMKLQNNPPPNPSHRITNLEANMMNFNQNFPSRRPQPQQQSRMPSSLNYKSFQTGIDQKPGNPLRIGSFKAPQPSVSSTKQPINSGPKTSSVIGPGSPISLFPNTTATNLPSRPPNYQPSAANQKFNLDKMKQPMHKPNELTGRKVCRPGRSPLGSRLVNQCRSPQFSLPSSVNPISQQTSISSSRFDVNNVLSPQSIARSPFLLYSNSSMSSGPSSLTTVESQKAKTPMGPPSKEPQNSKDPVFRLTEVVKSISSNSLGCSLTDISSIEKVMDIIPDCVPTNLVGQYIKNEANVMLEYDNEPKMRRELNVSSMYSNQFDSQEWDIYSTETLLNKRSKIENKWALLEEIKEINSKLLETTMNVVLDPSEDNINILGHEGTIIKCLFRNVCFPDLLGPQGGILSEKMPEFVILLLVPVDYPVSSTRIFKSGRNVLNSEPWGKLYEEMLTRFDLSIRGVPGILCLGDMAKKWDASARAVMTEFMHKVGGKSFSSRYGSWESCINSSSGSN